MEEDLANDLLIRAEQVYGRVVGDPSGSRAAAERLVSESRTAGHAEALVAALRALGHAHRYLLRPDRAAPVLDEAVRLARRHRLDRRWGEALVTRGALRHELGLVAAARRDFEQAAAVLGPEQAAEVDLQRAALAHNAGRLTEAAQLYKAVLRRTGVRAETRYGAANNLGLIDATLGRHRSAASWLDQAAAAAAEVGPACVALVAESRAWATVRAGRLADGMARFDDAVRLWEGAGLPLGELYADYADALADLRLLPEAREQAQRAAEMLNGQGVPLMAAEAQLRVAVLAAATGNHSLAESVAEETTAELRRQRRKDWAARACLVALNARLAAGNTRPNDHAAAARAGGVLVAAGVPTDAAEAYLTAGRVAMAGGRPSLAVADWGRAAALARRGPVLVRLKGHLAEALAANARRRDAEVLRACRTGLSDLARHRAALPSTELRALASGHGAELSALGLGALARTGTPVRVLAWMERTRGSALTAVEPASEDGQGEEMAALRAVHAEIARAWREHSAAPRELLTRQTEIESRIRRNAWSRPRPAGGVTGSSGPFSTAALRGALGDRVLVEYDLLGNRLVAAVLDSRRARLVELGAISAVESEISSLRMLLGVLAAGSPAAMHLRDVAAACVERLTTMLIAPLRLPDTTGAVIVPVGELQRVPWSALLDRPVSVVPSAALWILSHQRTPPEAPVVLAAGPGLPGAVEEVRAIAASYPGAHVLVPPAGGVGEVRSALRGAALAHLACHGRVRLDNPTFSAIRLADGELTVHEFDRGAGAPYRLILAACDVGSGITYPGNEVLGFVGTLLTRGAAGLVACATPVPDHHVTRLMLALHECLRAGHTLADALHAARTTIDAQDALAYPAWCAFNAYGAA